MTFSGMDAVCPHLEENDRRCACRWTVSRFEGALAYCLGAFSQCPTYHRIAAERPSDKPVLRLVLSSDDHPQPPCCGVSRASEISIAEGRDGAAMVTVRRVVTPAIAAHHGTEPIPDVQHVIPIRHDHHSESSVAVTAVRRDRPGSTCEGQFGAGPCGEGASAVRREPARAGAIRRGLRRLGLTGS